MNEIEVKAKLRDRKKVLDHLKSTGLEPSGKKYQKDTVFWPNDIKDITEDLLGRNFMRIREEEKNGTRSVAFTLKQPRSNRTDHIEYEIEVQEKDKETLTALIKILGYYEFVVVEKIREKIKLGEVEICLDQVTDLGDFIELEKLGPEEEVLNIQAELRALLRSWGIEENDYVYDGYDVLVHEAKSSQGN